MDQVTVQRVRFLIRTQAIEAADRKRDHVLIKRRLVTDQRVLFEAREPEA